MCNIEQIETFLNNLLDKKSDELEIQELRGDYIRLFYDRYEDNIKGDVICRDGKIEDTDFFDLQITKSNVMLYARNKGSYTDDVIFTNEDFFEKFKEKINQINIHKLHKLNTVNKEKTFDVLYDIIGMNRYRKINKILKDE